MTTILLSSTSMGILRTDMAIISSISSLLLSAIDAVATADHTKKMAQPTTESTKFSVVLCPFMLILFMLSDQCSLLFR